MIAIEPDGTVYPLRTLQDIFNLPSHAHMERCLGETVKLMLTSRATADLMIGLAEHSGAPAGHKMQWPEVLEWKDDGLGEIGADFIGKDGAKILSMNITKEGDK